MPTFGVAVKAIIRKEAKYLIIKKSKSEDVAPDTFDLPGGRVQFGEGLEEALHREVREETGLEIDVKKPINAWTFTDGDFQLVGITYLCDLKGGELALSGEHVSSAWLSLEELKASNLPPWLIKEFEKATFK